MPAKAAFRRRPVGRSQRPEAAQAGTTGKLREVVNPSFTPKMSAVRARQRPSEFFLGMLIRRMAPCLRWSGRGAKRCFSSVEVCPGRQRDAVTIAGILGTRGALRMKTLARRSTLACGQADDDRQKAAQRNKCAHLMPPQKQNMCGVPRFADRSGLSTATRKPARPATSDA